MQHKRESKKLSCKIINYIQLLKCKQKKFISLQYLEIKIGQGKGKVKITFLQSNMVFQIYLAQNNDQSIIKIETIF